MVEEWMDNAKQSPQTSGVTLNESQEKPMLVVLYNLVPIVSVIWW